MHALEVGTQPNAAAPLGRVEPVGAGDHRRWDAVDDSAVQVGVGTKFLDHVDLDFRPEVAALVEVLGADADDDIGAGDSAGHRNTPVAQRNRAIE